MPAAAITRGAPPGFRGNGPVYAVAGVQPSCLTTRTVEAGCFSSFSAGRIGRETSSPPPTYNFDVMPVVTEPAYAYSGKEELVEH